MKNKISLFLVPFLLISCASLTKTNFAQKAETSGIAPADVSLVDAQTSTFYGDYQRASMQGNRVSAAQLQVLVSAQMNKINNTYCNCVKKLGDKCQGNGSSLNVSEKDTWVKGNGAAEAVGMIQRSPADPMGCPST